MSRYRLPILLGILSATVCIGENVPKTYLWDSDDGVVRYDRKDDKWHLSGQPYSGRITQRYNSGAKRRELRVADGVPHGVSIWYFEDGKIAEMMTWSNGKLVGALCRWSEDGELREVSSYVDGKMHGVCACLYGPEKDPNDQRRVWEIDLYESGKVVERFRSENTSLLK